MRLRMARRRKLVPASPKAMVDRITARIGKVFGQPSGRPRQGDCCVAGLRSRG